MHRLKNVYCGERAAVILGGPSLIEQRVDLASLRKRGFIVFLESKALTPHFLSFGFEPDYYLMLFPDKCKVNALQNFIYRALLAQVNIRPYLKRPYHAAAEQMADSLDRYFEPWQRHRVHKRFAWRPGAYVNDSPFDLLRSRLHHAGILVNRPFWETQFPGVQLPNTFYSYQYAEHTDGTDLDEYYTPVEHNGTLAIRMNQFLNSAAIALYPLLRYMGFREVFFLGMDMSMIGSFEYAACYTFKSMAHFWWYFRLTQRAFNHHYRMNRPYFLRPREEFKDLARLLNYPGTSFTRVYDPFKYAAPIDGIRTISLKEFARQ